MLFSVIQTRNRYGMDTASSTSSASVNSISYKRYRDEGKNGRASVKR